MKAAVLYANEDIRYEEIPTPELKADQVLVKVKAVGICGSDVPRVLQNGAHYYPIVLGHEFSGEIVALGDGVTADLKVGDRVAGVPLVPCFQCEDCKNGNFSLCKHYTFIGSRVQGAFAEYVAMPQQNVVKFDSSVPFETAAFFEPSTVALHGLEVAGYAPGGHVAVLGGGTIGMFTFQWAKLLGAASVTVFDISPERLALAKELGADYVVNTLEENFEEELKKTFPRGFDYVFETAGQAVTEKLAFRLCGNRKKICLIGTPTRELVFTPAEFELINRKEFNLTGSWMSYSAPFPGKEWTMTAEYFSNGSLKINETFIYKKYLLCHAKDAFMEFKNPRNVKGKILLVNE